MKKKLNLYKGSLDASQIAAGMNAARKNAMRLLEDAQILLEAKRIPSAASLAILSIEEAGKCSILRSLLLARDEKELAKCWRDYRSHTKKNATWMLPELVSKGARKLDDFHQLFDENSEHPFLLDQIKQIGFYTDCLGNAHWSEPQQVIDEQLASSLVQIAGIFAKDTKTTTQEIELWVKHVKPVWMTNSSSMKKAITDWYFEMQTLGLAPQGENHMEQFIKKGI